MDIIKVKDREFKLMLSRERISESIKAAAEKISPRGFWLVRKH